MSKPHKSGFVNLIGHPNVGKSTLANALVGERLSIITPKAQTTRHRIFGILNGETEAYDYQVVFSDTPGVLDPAYELQERMLDAVREALKDADVFLYVVELGEGPLKNEGLFKHIQTTTTPVLVLLSYVIGPTPMDLQFWPGAVVMMFIATMTASLVTNSGRSAWFVGVLLLTDVVDQAEALSGLSSSAPITIAALYVLAGAATVTGALSPVIDRVLDLAGFDLQSYRWSE